MSAPDRSTVVINTFNTQPPPVVPFPSDDDRREYLLGVIIPALNKVDPGQWGALRKDDQGGRIPADIVVWRETREHFDVLTDSGPAWIADGILTNPQWVWMDPTPNTPPSPDPGTTYDMILAQLNNLSLQIKALTEYTTGAMAVLAAGDIHIAERQDRPLVGRVFGYPITLTPKG